jgi:predicted amidohydrolase
MTSKKLYTISAPYASLGFQKSLMKLEELALKAENESIILAPEYFLGGYDYEDLQSAYEFVLQNENKIEKLSKNKTLCFSVIHKENGKFYNRAKVYKDTKVIYQRDKIKLFLFGNEDRYFAKGKDEDLKIFEIDGLKIGILICFELRFIDYWQKLRGADLIMIPAYWGKERKGHLQTLSRALAIANQCYVMVANSKDKDMASSSAIIDPFGNYIEDDKVDLIDGIFDRRLIMKMRRYMNVGIKW